MDRDNGKGKAIVSESDGKSPREGVRNQGVRADGSSITREINLSIPPRSNENNSVVDPSLRWVVHNGRFIREINLPPLARNSINNSWRNRNTQWVRVSFPTHRDISWFVPRVNPSGEGTSAQGAAMSHGSTPGNLNSTFPHPNRPAPRPYYHLPNIVQPPVVFYRPPTTWPVVPRQYVNNSGEGTSTQGELMGNGVSNSSETNAYSAQSISLLNQYALAMSQAPIEDRSLFITFSNGQPLTKEQVFWYLATIFGLKNLVEVDINKPRRGPAHFGRVVFTTALIPMMILKGQAEAQFNIYDRSMICKKYVPKERRNRR